jgi:hypothetical protein
MHIVDDGIQLAPIDRAGLVVQVLPAYLLAQPVDARVFRELEHAVAVLPGRCLAVEQRIVAIDEGAR